MDFRPNSAPKNRVRININRTSTNKYNVEKTIEVEGDIDLLTQEGRDYVETQLREANKIIARDIADMEYRIGIGRSSPLVSASGETDA